MQPQDKNLVETIEKAALSMTSWIGSVWSLIVHTIIFLSAFTLVLFGVPLDRVLLVLTTVLSLEAIYLSIFIQMSVNKNTKAIEETKKDLEEIHEDVEEIHEDVEEIQEDVHEIAEDVEEISHDVEEMQEDVQEIAEDVEEIQEDVEELQEESDKDEQVAKP